MKEVSFYATRDSATAWRDEDVAMTHASIYSGDSLDEARAALKAYIVGEVEWLVGRTYRSATGLRRAAELLEASNAVLSLAPQEGEAWSAAKVEAAGLIWKIVRVEREVAAAE
jgi:hypothetical protein